MHRYRSHRNCLEYSCQALHSWLFHEQLLFAEVRKVRRKNWCWQHLREVGEAACYWKEKIQDESQSSKLIWLPYPNILLSIWFLFYLFLWCLSLPKPVNCLQTKRSVSWSFRKKKLSSSPNQRDSSASSIIRLGNTSCSKSWRNKKKCLE